MCVVTCTMFYTTYILMCSHLIFTFTNLPVFPWVYYSGAFLCSVPNTVILTPQPLSSDNVHVTLNVAKIYIAVGLVTSYSKSCCLSRTISNN